MFFSTVCWLLQTLRARLDDLSVTGAPLKDHSYQVRYKPEEKKTWCLTLIKDQFPYSTRVESRMKVKQAQKQLQGKPPLGIDEQVNRLIYVSQFEVSDAQGTTFPSVSIGVFFSWLLQPG